MIFVSHAPESASTTPSTSRSSGGFLNRRFVGLSFYMVMHPTVRLKIELPEDAVSVSDLSLNHDRNRNTLRTLAITEFLKESPGTGNKDLTSAWRYDVEELSDGRMIYITRPAFLNKGFDFVVNVEKANFPNGKTYPRHVDISDDLRTKLSSLTPLGTKVVERFKNQMLEMLEQVYYGVDIELIVENYELDEEFISMPGMEYEVILKVVKWLFIEQDICYWNWSGRAMLMKGLREVLA